VHGGISRRHFLDRAKKFAVGGVTAAALLQMLKPNYGWAIPFRCCAGRSPRAARGSYISFKTWSYQEQPRGGDPQRFCFQSPSDAKVRIHLPPAGGYLALHSAQPSICRCSVVGNAMGKYNYCPQ
jgi:hypothetical protein